MRSLALKLTLAFLLVGLIGAVLVAILVRTSTQRDFGKLVLDQNQQALVSNLTRYYQTYHTWDGVDTIFRSGPQENGPRGPETHWESRKNLFALSDADGNVIFGGGPGYAGRRLAPEQLKEGIALNVNGETIGWLVFIPDLGRWEPGTLEGNFLLGVSRAASLSAIAATGIALILGGILAFTMTRSLRELTAATRLLAQGQLGQQVQVRSQDELGELATSFNQMSLALKHSTELRQKMTANIAHDLRTPLSVIMGYAEALNDGKLSASPEIFQVVHTEAQHLSHLVDDLKTLSLADAHELPLTCQKIQPGDLLNRAANSYREQAERKNISLQMEVAHNLADIEVDVERMAQVLGNLMSNALRYTPEGGNIWLKAKPWGEGVQITVADSGPGIPSENLPYIFERSFRGDKARQQENGESGLGLAIARSLVEAQGGTIAVESAVGQGTEFNIQLPIAGVPSLARKNT